MKKTCLCLLLAAVFLLLCACGAKTPSHGSSEPTAPIAEPAPSAAPNTEPAPETTEPTEPVTQPETTAPTVTVPVDAGKPDVDMDYTMPNPSDFVDIDPIDISKIDFSGSLISGS